MKVLVVGTGSVGRRHAENLRALGAEVATYSYRAASMATNSECAFEASVPSDLETALDAADAVVVANRNDQHVAVATESARRGKAVFVEKPLSNSLRGTSELLCMERDRSIAVEAGFTLRCHPNVSFIRALLRSGDLGEVICVRAAVGQWLPDWRPGTDYTKSYAARRNTGGGVLFDLVHEIDLVHLFVGPISVVSCMRRTVPQLRIETESVAQLTLRCESGVLGQVHMDYVRRGYGRSFEVVGTKGTLTWDYLNATVHRDVGAGRLETLHVANGFQRNEMFVEHMKRFISRVRAPEIPATSSLGDSVAVLRLALAGHLSDSEGRHVSPSEVLDEYTPT